MKPKKLYIKILLTFIGVLFVTEILILALFIATAGRSFKHRIDRQAAAKLAIFKQSVESKLTLFPDLPIEKNQALIDFLNLFSQLLDIKIWMTAEDGTLLYSGSGTPVELSLGRPVKQDIHQDGIRLYQISKRRLSYYATIRIRHQDHFPVLHLYLNREHEKKPEAVFVFGLLTIGGVIALLIIPLTRLITRRIAQVNASALDFAGGNLKRRATVKGQDEIAELAQSFNFMADRLEKMIQGNQEMMANLSHELRSPLARIRMSKELIRDRLDGIEHPDITRYADHMDQDIDILDNLIDQILKLSKMDFQDHGSEKEPVLLAPFFNDIEKRYLPVVTGKGLTIKKEIDKDLKIFWNRQSLDTVFSNLIDNAVKYTDSGREIRVTAKKTGDDVQVVVANPWRLPDGTEAEKLFNPFYRVDKSHVPGSGLGLTMVKKLLEKDGASIRAEYDNSNIVFDIRFKTV